MTEAERMLYAAAFGAAYVAEIGRLRRSDVFLDQEIAARAAGAASEAVQAARAVYHDRDLRRYAQASRDLADFLGLPEET